jgi:hypothetical protein
VTPTFIQIRFGIAIGIVAMGFARLGDRPYLGLMLTILGCTFHIGVIYFSLTSIAGYILAYRVKKNITRIIVIGFLIFGPALFFEIAFGFGLLSEYYLIYFTDDYENVVLSLSALAYMALFLVYVLLHPSFDRFTIVICGGLGILLLVFTTGFAVFHRLYFPAYLILFSITLDKVQFRLKGLGADSINLIASSLSFPLALYFVMKRLYIF